MNNRPEGYSSRSDKRKDKRVNRIYNILITVVVILIFVVGATIFMGDDEAKIKEPANEKTESTQKDSDKKASAKKEKEENKKPKADDAEKDKAVSGETDEEGQNKEDEAQESKIVEEQASGQNVKRAYSDTAWKPVGTSQSGEHVTQFNKGTTDWAEMEKALAYGAGLNQQEMTIWFLENGGAPNKAVGTVSPKEGPQTFRVYIQWIDGEGWKPTKVEELVKNDKGR